MVTENLKKNVKPGAKKKSLDKKIIYEAIKANKLRENELLS